MNSPNMSLQLTLSVEWSAADLTLVQRIPVALHVAPQGGGSVGCVPTGWTHFLQFYQQSALVLKVLIMFSYSLV